MSVSRAPVSPTPAPLAPPLVEGDVLVDVHAHFLHAGCGRADWRDVNASRLRAGDAIGITHHVASALGTFGFGSPTYFASPADVVAGNDAILHMAASDGRVLAYAHVNPNHPEHAIAEIDRCVARGAVGVKLSASRRADDALLDPIAAHAGRRALPILHHIWQGRGREWGGQEASDGVELGALARRHPATQFILAHIGGGGDYAHTFGAVADLPNVYLDLSGSGVDRGMLDDATASVGASRLLWGCDVTMCTGLAKLWALEHAGLPIDAQRDVRWRNAARIFPPQSFHQAAARSTARAGRADV